MEDRNLESQMGYILVESPICDLSSGKPARVEVFIYPAVFLIKDMLRANLNVYILK